MKDLKIGPVRVDIFNRVVNPNIWMYYLLDLSTNQVPFVLWILIPDFLGNRYRFYRPPM